jgi:hypothetical protein
MTISLNTNAVQVNLAQKNNTLALGVFLQLLISVITIEYSK